MLLLLFVSTVDAWCLRQRLALTEMFNSNDSNKTTSAAVRQRAQRYSVGSSASATAAADMMFVYIHTLTAAAAAAAEATAIDQLLWCLTEQDKLHTEHC